MVLEMVGIFTVVFLLACVITGIMDHNRHNKNYNMSFKEAMDLTDLPVVTFYSDTKKLNFLLDTGSNLSYINSSVLNSISCNKSNKDSMDTIGVEGNKVKVDFYKIKVSYKNQEFEEDFAARNLDDAFSVIKEESGVQIHGILGSLFFQKYKYILDFESLIAYSKK